MGGRCLLIGLPSKDGSAGFEPIADPDGKDAALYGARSAPQIVVIAPNRHVAAIGDAAAASGALHRIAARRATATNHPPVLMVPDVLSRADCQRLISIFAMQGHTFLEPGHGAPPPGIGDYKMRIPEYGRKDRIDHWIMTPETNAFIDDRLKRRVFPEIRKCFQYKITRREGYRIGCYEGERGGDLHGHRDNTQPQVAHRRFACSVNLNSEQFEGGGIRFPEFGDQEYSPETGGAVIFSSSLLHEPMHVTSGKRYVLLAFLYGET
ncbi:MAG TPA: 2OG-Fe(II) oxygenase [Dongiaceae bacterium]|nr:2OG-Fe(II) oxygenase [Dongiaceae bacterium]